MENELGPIKMLDDYLLQGKKNQSNGKSQQQQNIKIKNNRYQVLFKSFTSKINPYKQDIGFFFFFFWLQQDIGF